AVDFLEQPAQRLFGLPFAIARRSVDPVHARADGSAQSVELDRVVLMDQHAADPTAAEHQFRYLQPRAAECPIAHRAFLQLSAFQLISHAYRTLAASRRAGDSFDPNSGLRPASGLRAPAFPSSSRRGGPKGRGGWSEGPGWLARSGRGS